MGRTIKFLIIDDQAIVRESLLENLKSVYEQIEVAQASSGKRGHEMVGDFNPDIIFMDISMPEMDGIATTRMILSDFPGQKIIGFSVNDNDEVLNRMLKAGATGYLLKTDMLEDFIVAIDSVLCGQVFISRNLKR